MSNGGPKYTITAKRDEPVVVSLPEYNQPSRRDLFAAAALQGLLANPSVKVYDCDKYSIASDAFYLADAMLEADK